MFKSKRGVSLILSGVLAVQILTSSAFNPIAFGKVDTTKTESLSNILPTVSDSVYGNNNVDVTENKEVVQVDNSNDKRIIVKYKNSTKAKNNIVNVEKAVGKSLKKLKKEKTLNFGQMHVYRIDGTDDIKSTIDKFKDNEDVEYVQEDFKMSSFEFPTDERFEEQWNLNNNGQSVYGQAGTSGVDINALEAWTKTKGAKDVVVGVIDTGVDISHEDLSANIYINKDEIVGNGIDDDADGFVDNVNGWDFANDDITVYDSVADQHGTHVAGIIGASENGTGVCGAVPNVKILPVKFIEGNTGYTSDAIEAINYCKSMGVDVVNISWGSTSYNQALKDAMEDSGLLYITAAGNFGVGTSTVPVYPACFDLPNILSVAAIDNNGKLASFSSYGSDVDVAAPGLNILSTLPGNKYGVLSGTSMACPAVTGIAALLKSYKPDITIDEIVNRIKNNVVKSYKLEGKVASSGRVDANAVLENVVPQAEAGNSVTTTPAPINNSEKKGIEEIINASQNNDPKANDKIVKPLILENSVEGQKKTNNISHEQLGIDGVKANIQPQSISTLSYIYEVEPNDTSSTGMTVPIGTTFGTAESASGNDWYITYLQANKTYTFSLKGIQTGDDLGLFLFKPDLTDADFSDNFYNADENITYTTSVAGYYYIDAYCFTKGSAASHNYQLLIYPNDASPDSNEPNDSISTAKTISNNTAINGTINITTDDDWYVLDTTETGKLTASLENIPSDCDYDISVYDANNSYLGGSYNSSNTNEKANVLISNTGKYYIRVYSYSGVNSSSYSLNAVVSKPDSYETNDYTYEATSVDIGNSVLGTIDNIRDQDWYKVTIDDTVNYVFELENIPSGRDYDMYIYDGDGYYVTGSAYGSNNDELVNTQLSAGVYYVKIYPYSNFSDEQSYKFSVYKDNAVNISLPYIRANAGDQIVVPVYIENVPQEGICSFDFKVKYDESALSYTGYEAGALTNTSDALIEAYDSGNGINVLYLDNSITFANPITSAGELIKLKFAVNSAVTDGAYELMYNDGWSFGKKVSNDIDDISNVVFKPGMVVVGSYGVSSLQTSTQPIRLLEATVNYGDVNGDEAVNSIDFGYMRMYLLGMKDQVKMPDSDVTGDGNVNAIDFAYMRQYLLGMITEFPAAQTTPTPTLIPTQTPTSTSSPTTTPTNLATCFEKIVAGGSHTVALKADGTVWTWGLNSSGQLGYGDNIDKNIPQQVNSLNNVKDIAAGRNYTIALKEDGTVWTWGANSDGQLGLGDNIGKNTPIQVDIQDVKAIAAGAGHTIVLKEDGTVWAWGFNFYGQLGNGNNINTNTPILVNIQNVKAIAAGSNHTVVIKVDGTVWTWGYNSNGELGNGQNINTNTPVPVNIQNVKDIAAGYFHTVALKGDGTVWAWGDHCKEPGINTNTPIQVNIQSVKDIAAGSNYTLALKEDKTVWAWGSNYYSQLGDETVSFTCTPIQVNIQSVKAVAAGYDHIVVLEEDGTLLAWGSNGSGQLGDGTTNGRKSPQQVIGISGVADISAGTDHTIVLKEDGTVWTWGYNHYGQLGYRSYYNTNTPKQVEGISDVVAISAGWYHSVALKKDGTVWVWGANGDGQLSMEGSYDRFTPIQVKGISNVVAVSAGGYYTVVLKDDGTVWAWGNNFYGQLGDETTFGKIRRQPKQITQISDVVAISSGGAHNVALTSKGNVLAWGYNGYGQLGVGNFISSSTPQLIEKISDVVMISAGGSQTVAKTKDGKVWAWGCNKGYLGDGTNEDKNVPQNITEISKEGIIAAGGSHTVVLNDDGTVWVWGDNTYGQLGNDTYESVNMPASLVKGLTGVTKVTCGLNNTVAVKYDGTVWNCGMNTYGQLGIPNLPRRVINTNETNLTYITLNNQFIPNFNENTTTYEVILPIGYTSVPEIKAGTYSPNASYVVRQPASIPGVAYIDVTAEDGVTKKTYEVRLVTPEYAELMARMKYGKSGVGASGNFSRTYTDMKVAAPGFDIVFSRTYNSGNRKNGSMGRGWTFGFESEIKAVAGYTDLTQVELPNGSIYLFKWDEEESKFIAENSRNTLTHNSDGSYVLTTKDQYTYGYNSDGHLVWMKDRYGNQVTINVNSIGEVQSVTDQAGKVYDIGYEDGYLHTISDIQDGVEVTLVTYDYSHYRLAKVTDAGGIITNYDYKYYSFDPLADDVAVLNEVSEGVDKHLIESIKYYDYTSGVNNGKISKTMDRNGNVFTYTYDLANRTNIVADSNDNKTITMYDDNYSVAYTREAYVWSNTVYYTDDKGRNKYNEEKVVKDKNGNTTIYNRDGNGNITKIINPDLSEKEYQYDDKNNLKFEQDEAGNKTYYVYDTNKVKLLYVIKPINKADVYNWQSPESMSQTEKDKFAITSYLYYTEAECNSLGYLAKGLVKSVTDPLGGTVTYTYYPNGNIRTESNPETNLITTYEYNSMGLKSAEETAKGYRTEYEYDNNGKLERKTIVHPTDSTKNSVTRIVYDSLGRIKQEISPNQYNAASDDIANHQYNDITKGTRYAYNSKGQLLTVTDADGNLTSYPSYDLYGNVLIEVKPKGFGVYKYDYDLMNRITKKWFKNKFNDLDSTYVLLEERSYIEDAHPIAKIKSYLNDTETAETILTYDYAGRLLTKKNPQDIYGSRSFTSSIYDGNGRIKESTDEKGYTAYYKYDLFDTRRYDEKRVPVELDGTDVKYNYSRTYYDKLGRVVEEWTSKELVSKDAFPSSYQKKTIDYYEDGQIKYIQYSDGRRTDYYYDDDRILNRIEEKKDITNTVVTEYENGFMGKADIKKLHVRKGDIAGNSFDDNTDITIDTSYTYDKEGKLKTIEEDNVYTDTNNDDKHTITYLYDNLGRQTGTEELVITEDGTEKTLRNESKLNCQGNPLTTEIKVNGATTRLTSYDYYDNGLLRTITDAMPSPKTGTTLFAYDRGGRKIYEVSPENYVVDADIATMDKNEYTYDKLNRVITVAFVGKVEYYNQSGLLEMPTEQSTTIQKAYKYDASGNVIKELDAEGYLTYPANVTSTNVRERIDAGYGTEYLYNPIKKVKAVIDPVSKEKDSTITFDTAPLRYNYDALGRVSQEITTHEEKSGTTYTKYDSIKSYEYYEDGNVKSVKGQKNASASNETLESAEYDYLGNVKTKTDGNEKTTIFEYNNLGKVRKIITPSDESIDSNTVNYQYDKAGNLKKTVDTKGTSATTDDVTQLYTYDNRGKVLSNTIQKQNEASISTSAKYDIYGNKYSETDGNGKTTTYSYNELNKLTGSSIDVYDIDNVKTTYTKIYDYDKNGNLLSETDNFNNAQSYTYDTMNRLREKKDPDQKSIQKINYNADSTQSESFDALNHKISFTYDKNNKLLKTTDAESHYKENSYDINGNVKTEDDGKGHITYYGYDYLGRLTEVSISVDNVLQTTYYNYDLNNNMTSQKDAKEHTTIYDYNAVNKLKKIVDHGGRVSGQTDVAAKTESYMYYADGNLKTKTDRNGVLSNYNYYATGRLYTQTLGTANTQGYVKTTYIYDGNGNQENVSETTYVDGASKTIITERLFDELNRVKQKVEYKSGESETSKVYNKFKYAILPATTDLPGITTTSSDIVGFVGEKSTISKNGTVLATTLKVNDKVGRLKYVVADDQTTTYNYFDNGNRESIVYSGGTKEVYAYYDNNLLRTLINYKKENGVDAVIDNYEYHYDGANNQDWKTESISGVSKGKTQFEYDELNRLKKVTEHADEATANQKITTYTYDKAGNRNTELVTDSTGSIFKKYDYNEQNRLKNYTKRNGTNDSGTLIETIGYTYDNNGNQTKEEKTVGTTTTTILENIYDNLNRVIKTTATGGTITNNYNGDGLRFEKKKLADSSITRNLYEFDKVVFELNGSGTVTAKNVIGTNIISRTVGTEKVYYLYNGHADVTALIDSSNTLIAQYYYDPFGNPQTIGIGEGNYSNPFRYSGYVWDGETGLYYLNARMYDPKVARFLQEDTYRGTSDDPLSLNLYTYCHNEPIMYTDPTGNTPIRELFGEINGTVDWHQSKSSEFLSYATVTLNGLSFYFVIDENDNIMFATEQGFVMDEDEENKKPKIFGRFTFDYRNPNSKSKFMDIDTAKTLGAMGLYALANDADNPVTAFAVVDPSMTPKLPPLNETGIELRKDFYNALVETGFDANSYDEKMVKAVFASMKAKNDYVKDDFGIRTMLKAQQNFAMNITSWDLYVASLQYDLNRLSVLQGAIGGMAPNAMGNSFLYPKGSYSMKVNGKEYFPKNGSETAFKGTLNTNKLNQLPNFQSGGKTSGILEANGFDDLSLISGVAGPAKQFQGVKVPGMNLVTKTHVEGHAAAYMRQNGIKEATLYINNPPCTHTTGCNNMLPRMLPEGAKLTVIGPNGYKQVFIGLPD